MRSPAAALGLVVAAAADPAGAAAAAAAVRRVAGRRARRGDRARHPRGDASTRRSPASSRWPRVIQRDRTQAEIVQTLDQYLKQRVTARVVRTAQSMRATHATVLRAGRREVRRADRGSSSRSGGSNRTSAASAACGRRSRRSRRSPTIRAARRSSASELFDALTHSRQRRRRTVGVEGIVGRARSASRSSCPPASCSTRRTSTATAQRDIWKSTPDVFALDRELSRRARLAERPDLGTRGHDSRRR